MSTLTSLRGVPFQEQPRRLSLMMAILVTVAATACGRSDSRSGEKPRGDAAASAFDELALTVANQSLNLATKSKKMFLTEADGGSVVATSSTAAAPQTFSLYDINGTPLESGDTVYLKGPSGKFLAVVDGKLVAVTNSVVARRDFKIVRAEGGTGRTLLPGEYVALQTSANTYVTALTGGGGSTSVSATTVGEFEKFAVTLNGRSTFSERSILPRCETSPVAPGPRVWRLTAVQWKNTLKDLGSDSDLASFPQDSKAGSYDTNPNGLIAGRTHAAFFNQEALRASAAVFTKLRSEVTCAATDATFLEKAACRSTFVDHSVARVFRRPPTAEEKQRLGLALETLRPLGDVGTVGADFVQILLRSPHFIHRVALTEDVLPGARQFAAASHLSYTLTDAPPDATLVQLARTNALVTSAELDKQAKRLLNTASGQTRFLDFVKQWLMIKVPAGNEPIRDKALFPHYTAAIYKSMVAESEHYFAREALQGRASIQSIFSSTKGYTTPALDAYYRRQASNLASNEVQATELGDVGRFGVLTHGSVVVAMSMAQRTNATHRASTLRSHFFCSPIGSRPGNAEDVAKTLPPVPSNATERMLYDHFVANAPVACASCHRTFVPVGLAMENYGADGLYRQMDKGKPIVAGGVTNAPNGVEVKFKDGQDFLSQVSSWNAVAQCTLLHAHEFHWGSTARQGHGCALETEGKETGVASTFVDVYLAPIARQAFYQPW